MTCSTAFAILGAVVLLYVIGCGIFFVACALTGRDIDKDKTD